MKKLIYIATLAAFLGCGSDDGVSLRNETSTETPSQSVLIYSGNGETSGAAPVDASSPYQPGSTVTVLANTGNLVKTGVLFAGWNTASDGSGTTYFPSETFSMPSSDITLFARWRTGYLVTYDGNGASGGTAPNDNQSPYLVGETVTVLGNSGNLVRGGYQFVGWNTAANGSGTDYSAAATFNMPAANRTLYAKWSTLPTYTVIYDGNTSDSGTVPTDSSSYWPGAEVPVSTNIGNLAKVGHTFAGWSLVGDSSQHTVGEIFYMSSANTTLNAIWISAGSYNVAYNGNGHSSGTVPVDGSSPYVAGGTVIVLGNSGGMVRGSDTFLGWNTASNGTGADYAPGATFAVSDHTVLYARWAPKYTVSFDANGGNGAMSSSAITSGTSAKLPVNAFTRANYVFAGWAVSATGPVIYNDQQSYPMGASNVILYAKWMATSSLKVQYNFNNQNAQDVSGNGQHGVASNVAYVLDGVGNYAVKMNGTNSYISLPDSTLKNSTNFTIMMRFKASRTQHGSLFGYQDEPVGDSAMQHVPVVVVRSDGRLRGELWTTPGGELSVLSNNSVNDGKWHTVYFSGDGTTIKLFLDGVLLGQASRTVNHLLMNYNQIGASKSSGRSYMPNADGSTNNWYYFNGLIDDFYFYNSAL